MISRRRFLLTTGGALAAGSCLRPALGIRQEPSELTVSRLREGVWAILGAGGNSLLAETSNGPVLVDTKVATAARDLYRRIEQLAGRGPVTVINTHHHADHIGGNFAFRRHARVVAHANVRPRIGATLDQHIRPALDFETGAALTAEDFAAHLQLEREMELDRGLVMRLYHFGFAHTDNDVVVHLPDLNILHTGDLVFHELHAFIDRAARGTTTGWQRALQQATALCDEETTVVPGHGEVADQRALAAQIDYFDQLRGIVQQSIRDGLSREQVVALKPEVFEGRGFERLQSQALGVVYDELNGPQRSE